MYRIGWFRKSLQRKRSNEGIPIIGIYRICSNKRPGRLFFQWNSKGALIRGRAIIRANTVDTITVPYRLKQVFLSARQKGSFLSMFYKGAV